MEQVTRRLQDNSWQSTEMLMTDMNVRTANALTMGSTTNYANPLSNSELLATGMADTLGSLPCFTNQNQQNLYYQTQTFGSQVPANTSTIGGTSNNSDIPTSGTGSSTSTSLFTKILDTVKIVYNVVTATITNNLIEKIFQGSVLIGCTSSSDVSNHYIVNMSHFFENFSHFITLNLHVCLINIGVC